MSRMTHIFKGSIRKKVENKNWEFLKRNIIEKKKKEISEDNQPIAFMESTCIVAFNAEKKSNINMETGQNQMEGQTITIITRAADCREIIKRLKMLVLFIAVYTYFNQGCSCEPCFIAYSALW